MKHKKHSNAGIALLFLIGFLILFYPVFSSSWNSMREKRLMNDYEKSVEKLEEEDLIKMRREAMEYNRLHRKNIVPDAFAEGEHTIDPVYEGLLNLEGDGVMAYLEIPVIGVSMPVLHGTSTKSLKLGAGHLEGSSLPVGGGSTNAVLAAHRGLPNAELFTDLPLVEKGDMFYLHVLGETLAYEVDDIRTVEPRETESLEIAEGKDYVTLVTCTPYGVNSHRLLVRGERREYIPEVRRQNQESKKTSIATSYLTVALAGMAVVAALAVLMRFVYRRKEKGR